MRLVARLRATEGTAQRRGGVTASNAGEDNPLVSQRARASRKVAEVEARRSGSEKRLSEVSATEGRERGPSTVSKLPKAGEDAGAKERRETGSRRPSREIGEVSIRYSFVGNQVGDRESIPFDGRHPGR